MIDRRVTGVKKNDIFPLTITDMGVGGEGIGKYEGMTFFVKDALIGDEIVARATKVKKNYGYARVEEITNPSPHRVEPECPLHRSCGGCQIQALSYAEQLAFKEQKVRNNLLRLGGFTADEVDAVMLPIVGMDEPYRYRNKAQFPVGTDKEGHVIAGFYAARTHSIIPVKDCMLGASMNQPILAIVCDWMEKYHVRPYNEEEGSGLVRHVLIRYGFTTKEIMVCLIVNGNEIPHEEELVQQLQKIDGMTSVSLNTNTERTNVILGATTHCIWGQPYITDYIHLRNTDDFSLTDTAIAYHISPQSFYQVNPEQTEKLYSIAMDYAGLTGEESVWDLYCGIGTISLFLSQKAKQVYGVEIVPQAIEDAKNNAKLNGITNAQFFVGKAEEVLPEFYEQKESVVRKKLVSESESAGDEDASMRHPDVIVVDPPRKGCDEVCLNTMLAMQPERIVYVSCDSATLARDLRVLVDGGYRLEKVRAVDQFAHTVHVETVVLLSKGAKGPVDLCSARTEVERRMVDSRKVKVDFSLEDMDLSEFKGKATYEQIKAYVLEKTGLKVSSLYIAQIKKKCGLDVGENFNPAKSENARQPQCTPEKEDAIMQAFRHFGII